MKVVSFSVWGRKRTYHEGVIENIALVKKHLPDWKVWVYTDGTAPQQSKMQDEGAELFIMPKAKDSGGAMWRFLPIGDKQVEVCLPRDADNRINAHTAKACEVFVQSGKRGASFMSHRQHFKRPLCAGGMITNTTNGQFTWKSMKPVIETYDSWWRDELYLTDNLYESNKRSWQFFSHDPMCVKNNLYRAKLWRPESEREDWAIIKREAADGAADVPFGMETIDIDGKCEENYFRRHQGSHGKVAHPEE